VSAVIGTSHSGESVAVSTSAMPPSWKVPYWVIPPRGESPQEV